MHEYLMYFGTFIRALVAGLSCVHKSVRLRPWNSWQEIRHFMINMTLLHILRKKIHGALPG